MSMRFEPRAPLHRVLCWTCVVLSGLLMLAGPAAAQTISQINTQDDRIITYEAESTLPTRREGSNRLTLRSAECLADAELVVHLQIMAPNSSYLLEAWAGSSGSCNERDARLNATFDPPQCWKLASEQNSQTELTLRLPVRRLLAQEQDAASKDYSSDICYTTSDLTVTLTLLHVNGSKDPVGTGTTLTIPVNTQGPPTPTGVTAETADRSLVVSWDVAAGNNVQTYEVYCLPADGVTSQQGAALTLDGGVGGAAADAAADAAPPSANTTNPESSASGAGSGASEATPDAGSGAVTSPVVTTNDTACDISDYLVNGELVLTEAQRKQYLCKSASGIAGSVRTEKVLTNNRRYAVVVVGLDESFNESELQPGACGVPADVVEAFEVYEAIGGEGGGGYFKCSTAGVAAKARTTPVASLLLGLLLTMMWIRRERKSA